MSIFEKVRTKVTKIVTTMEAEVFLIAFAHAVVTMRLFDAIIGGSDHEQ